MMESLLSSGQQSFGRVEACGETSGGDQRGESCSNRGDKTVDKDGSSVDSKGGTKSVYIAKVEVSRPDDVIDARMEGRSAVHQ